MEFGFFPHIFNPPLSFQVPCDHFSHHVTSIILLDSFLFLAARNSLEDQQSQCQTLSSHQAEGLGDEDLSGSRYQQRLTVVGGSVQHISHRIHVWNINRTHIWLIFLFIVNVDISSMHGSGGSAKTSYELSICLHHPQVSTPGSCPLKSMLFSMHPVFST